MVAQKPVLAVLREAGRPMSWLEIKRVLVARGMPEEHASVLTRTLKRLEKWGRGRHVAHGVWEACAATHK